MSFPFMLSLPVLSKAEGSKHGIDLGNSPNSCGLRVYLGHHPFPLPAGKREINVLLMKQEVQAEQIDLEEYESQPRKLAKKEDTVLTFMMVTLSVFQLYTSWQGPFTELIQRSIHLSFVLVAAFMMYPPMRRSHHRDRIIHVDKVFILLAALASLWITFNATRIQANPGWSTQIDVLLAPIMIFAILEATRRSLGLVLPTLVLLLILYALIGPHLPGTWAHRGFSIRMILESLYLEPDGIFGYIVGISATVIAGFLIFGVILSETGGGETFVDLAIKLAGRSHGGPAKVSCFSSAFFGTISGSAIANVVVDGVFNIPLMKGLGYKKEFAGAVEATTSTGGQIMPPVMGAGAFIMAEVLGIPYAKVALAAAIPAILYYTNCYLGIHFWARRLGLKPLPPEMIPSFRKKILPRSAPFIIPVSALVYFLSIGRNPALSVFYALMLCFATYLFLPGSKQTLGAKIKNIIKALDIGGRSIVMVAVLCVCAQMVIGLLTATGLGIKVSEMVIGFAHGNILIALILTAAITILLGMGVPTVAAYVLGASVSVPPLIKMGVLPLSAHMFVFYFAILSAITPPVCPAVYVASAIAKSNWLPTAWIAVRLGLAGFIVPFMFYYAPSLLLQGTVLDIVLNGVSAFIGIVALSAGVMGFFRRQLSLLEQLVMIVCGFLLIDPNLYTDTAAFIIMSYMYLNQRFGFSIAAMRRPKLKDGGT
jgi:TRAP transporter 4TM/12TM fusion protein